MISAEIFMVVIKFESAASKLINILSCCCVACGYIFTINGRNSETVKSGYFL